MPLGTNLVVRAAVCGFLLLSSASAALGAALPPGWGNDAPATPAPAPPAARGGGFGGTPAPAPAPGGQFGGAPAPAPAAGEQQFRMGQRVMFEDRFNRAGGGWVTGTIVNILDASCNCDRFQVRLDTRVNPAWQVQSFSAASLKPADGGQAPGAPASAAAEQQFRMGQRVMFEDRFNRAGGGWVTGTIVNILDVSCNCDRFQVRLDAKVNPAWQVQSFPASRLKPADAS